nr:protein anti-silencing 1 [Tanacetum cinerariifolium]
MTVSEPVTNKLQDDPDLLKRSISHTGSDKLNDPHSKKIKPDGKNLPKETRVEPVESIAGPCNVVCVSKDCRNPQPSDEELKAADFVFYRTFSV